MLLLQSLAYVICAPRCDSQKLLKKDVLQIKQDYLVPDTKKTNIDIRRRALMTDDDYQNIYSVIEESVKNKEVQKELIEIIIMSCIIDWTSFTEKPTLQECGMFDSRWYLHGQYLKEYSTREEVEAFIEEIIESPKLKNRSNIEFLMGPFKIMFSGNAKILPKFHAVDTHYLKENMGLMIESLRGSIYIAFHSNSQNYTENDTYDLIQGDYNVLEERTKTAKKRKAALLTNDPVFIPMSKEEEMHFMLDSALMKVCCEYALQDIDLSTILRTTNLSNKEIKGVILKAYNLFIIKEESLKDKEAFFEMVIRQLAIYTIAKRTSELYKTHAVKKEESKEIKAARNKISELQQKNEALTKKLNKAPQKDPRDEKIKALYGEIANLNKIIRQKDKDIEELSYKAIEPEFCAQEEVVIPENITEQFEEYITNHKVLVWGLRDADAARLLEDYPSLKFMSSDSRISQNQLKTYDVFIIGTGYTNHGSFWITRDFLKNADKPFAYMKKTDKTIDALAQAWAIATGKRS